MTKKTERLSFPTNPLAAMRELQDLDTFPSNDTPPGLPEESNPATPLLRPQATGSEVSSVAALAERSPGGSEVAKLPTAKRQRRTSEEHEPESDPIAGAVKELLSRPYTSGATKGPMTVSTVKIPGEVWERLGWAAKLTGQTKQDIISDALKDYFLKMLKEI